MRCDVPGAFISDRRCHADIALESMGFWMALTMQRLNSGSAPLYSSEVLISDMVSA